MKALIRDMIIITRSASTFVQDGGELYVLRMTCSMRLRDSNSVTRTLQTSRSRPRDRMIDYAIGHLTARI